MYIVVPTYNRFEECFKMIKSAENSTLKPKGVIVIDNSTYYGFTAYMREHKLDTELPIALMNSPTNLGCSRAWNAGIEIVHREDPTEWCLVVNDDIEFHSDCIELFDTAIKERGNTSVIFCAGGMDAPNAFSLFATQYNRLIDTSVGLFDPLFIYPYCEDGDMARRLMLLGYELDRVEGASANHIGSATLKAFDDTESMQHHARFKVNADYFQLKWNIDHNHIYSEEGYTVPFNGDETEKIMAESYVKACYGVR